MFKTVLALPIPSLLHEVPHACFLPRAATVPSVRLLLAQTRRNWTNGVGKSLVLATRTSLSQNARKNEEVLGAGAGSDADVSAATQCEPLMPGRYGGLHVDDLRGLEEMI